MKKRLYKTAALIAALAVCIAGFSAMFIQDGAVRLPGGEDSPVVAESSREEAPEPTAAEREIETEEETEPEAEPKADQPQDGVAIVWQDPQIEALAREYLQRPEGDIFPEELDDVTFMGFDAGGLSLGNLAREEDITSEYEQVDYLWIPNLNDLMSFRKLESVRFSVYEEYFDYTALHDLPNLNTIIFLLVDTQAVLPQIFALDKVKNLVLLLSDVSDLSGIAAMTNLESIILQSVPLTDVSPLADLPNLAKVELTDTNVTDLSPITHVPEVIVDGEAVAVGESASEEESFGRFTVYGDFLRDQSLEVGEVGEYGDDVKDPFLMCQIEGYDAALLRVDFYENPAYDDPVMIFVAVYVIDGYRALEGVEVAYIVRNGEVITDLPTEDMSTVFGQSETGAAYAKGDLIASFPLLGSTEDEIYALLEEMLSSL
jgi:hypothetical protein